MPEKEKELKVLNYENIIEINLILTVVYFKERREKNVKLENEKKTTWNTKWCFIVKFKGFLLTIFSSLKFDFAFCTMVQLAWVYGRFFFILYFVYENFYSVKKNTKNMTNQKMKNKRNILKSENVFKNF